MMVIGKLEDIQVTDIDKQTITEAKICWPVAIMQYLPKNEVNEGTHKIS